MLVAIRKRSWEEHVTHPSGLQYSYDDLDLVCCHGVDSEGPWMGAGASKQGRRTRCASMPEGCHQLSTEDLGQTREVTASVGIDYTESEPLKLKENNEKVLLDSQEGSVHGPHELVDVDITQSVSESEDLQTANMGNSGEFHCNSNSGMCSANISCPADSSSHIEKTVNSEGEVATESSQSHDICNDDNVFKRPHISREEQQCISISANNGLPLSECAGEQPGKLPNHQETKESHTEGYSRPPEISEATLNRSPAAELEPQTDLPDVEEDKISTSEHREHARLDSMVLLLMKLDQLDQEIENALSATSSMGSNPALHRRQHLLDLGSVPAASQNPPHPHVPAASSSGSALALGAKPKSGVSPGQCIISYHIISKT
uniref:Rho GTPase-activating protein 7 n=1 Tax=Seriola lalandi dorsalis TaxID=1841481 RepID=A0A3B4WJL9_SERLL